MVWWRGLAQALPAIFFPLLVGLPLSAREFLPGPVPAISLREIQLVKFVGRALARMVTLSGVDGGNALIEAGFGRAYSGGWRDSWCAQRRSR